jgi:hypothetical protein
MDSPHHPKMFATELLQQEKRSHDSKYQEYRMRLENALTVAERRAEFTRRVAAVCLVLGLVLLFVGGTKIFGSFDPWDDKATIVSVALGVMNVLAWTIGLVGMASYYSRFRIAIRETREAIRDTHLLALRQEIAELRQQVNAMSQRGNGAS